MHHQSIARRGLAAALLLGAAASARAQSSPAPSGAPSNRVTRANWTLANRFSQAALRSVVFTQGVQPRWLGQSDSLFYNWRDRNGTRFYLVVPTTRTKRPLFDQVKLAAQLTELSHRAVDPNSLPFTSLNFTKDHRAFRFVVDSTRYEWTLATESLRSLGRPPRDSIPQDEEREERSQLRGGRGGGGGQFGLQQSADFRNWSPDSTAFAFARNHNLYLVEKGSGDTIQLTTDGVKDYSFGWRDTTLVQEQEDQQQQQQQQQQGDENAQQGRSRDPRVRANVVWSPDSRAFAVMRTDQRKVTELYLVNALANPRPTLTSYRYAMPGEESVPQQELYVYRRGEKSLAPVGVKRWRDQRLMDVHWSAGHDRLRLVRRDRLQRNLELVEVELASGAVKPLIVEAVENASIETRPVRYVRRGGDMLWWSERSGWGHFYLYGNDGTLKRPLTSGAWHAESVVQIDTARGIVWLTGYGREAGENPYFQHLYRVNADGGGLALVDEGAYFHAETLSPSKRYAVDSYSRPDAPPTTVVRDASTGRVVMPLEEMDVARLKEMGWRPPESFVVKAADGVTDIYGNMWKPFDFDSTRKYPIVASVYPGPQTESVNATFNGSNVPQQLAQLGFIVIQIGNRGGSPLRSQAYHRFGYYNLRDYALADKKAGIEQLAARHRWIDVDRVGIYGHSGGGFLTAAAMMQPPYNDFFKVGVSSSGNHDNNIYNQNWSEQYHGLKIVAKAGSGRGGVVQAGA
ncbi:MAG TPA: DPP IV N-terminal domain-containing protein, partial [Gemmatimonadaceae bacterium]|nr:DPP IV N-terminal domain-containing protein [Gemmatimonadaceae bacterium]